MTQNTDHFQRIEADAGTANATPTDKQILAGNYKLGRTTVQGMPVSIENPRGSYRQGTDKNGKRWSNRLAGHYGFFPGTVGADHDPVDCFIGPFPNAETAFVINQYVDGKFDEHKVGIGWGSMPQFRSAYVSGFSDGKGKDRLKKMTEMDIEQFKQWLRDCDTTKPISRVA